MPKLHSLSDHADFRPDRRRLRFKAVNQDDVADFALARSQARNEVAPLRASIRCERRTYAGENY